MGVMDLAVTVTGAVIVLAGIAVVSALVCTPLAWRVRNTPLNEIGNPIEVGWAATARLLKPAIPIAVVAGLMNLVLQLLD